MYLETALQKMYNADQRAHIVFHFMKKTMKHLTTLTLTSTTPERISLKNRPRGTTNAKKILIVAFHFQNSRKWHALRKSKPVLEFAIPLNVLFVPSMKRSV